MTTTRQSPGKGYVGSYSTAAGTRFEFKCTLSMPNGTRKVTHRRGFANKTAANKAMRAALVASDEKRYAEPSRLLFSAYLDTWVDGLQLAPQTTASYRKNVRLHIEPYLGTLQLAAITPVALTAHYRMLETSGRVDGQGGLSPRTVRYVHTIVSAALRDAVEADLLQRNPASRAKPPTAKAAAAPEMHPWNAKQLAAFLAWSRDHSELFAAWYVLAYTGMRRGELLALRWKDIDPASGTITVKFNSGLVRVKGEGAHIETGPTKGGKPRVVDIDDATAQVLKAHKTARGSLQLSLVQPDALVFGDEENQPRNPEHFSREFNRTVRRCGQVPAIRLHDLRHTHGTLQF